MKTASRLFLFCAVTALFVLSFSVASAQDKTPITMWTDPTSDVCWEQTVADGFNAASTTAQIEIVVQPEAWDSTRVALTAGSGPDVVAAPGPSYVYEMANANVLLPLDEFAAQYGWNDAFAPWAMSLGNVNGKLYSLPDQLETLILYYNKTLFEEHGWTPPTTIDELMALSEQIAAAGIVPFAHANSDWKGVNEWFVGEMLNHVAGPQAVYEALTGARPWTDDVFAQSIDILNQMQANGWFSGSLELYYTSDEPTRLAALGSGAAAMNIEGTWGFGTIRDYFGEAAGNGNEWDWVPVPSTTGDAIFDIGIGNSWSINAFSQHPDLAAEFLNYLFSPEAQVSLLVNCGTAPAPINLPADAMENVDPRIARAFESFAEASAAGNYGYTTWAFWPPETDNYIIEQIEYVWAGNMTTADFLAGMNDLFAEELAAGTVPPIPAR